MRIPDIKQINFLLRQNHNRNAVSCQRFQRRLVGSRNVQRHNIKVVLAARAFGLLCRINRHPRKIHIIGIGNQRRIDGSVHALAVLRRQLQIKVIAFWRRLVLPELGFRLCLQLLALHLAVNIRCPQQQPDHDNRHHIGNYHPFHSFVFHHSLPSGIPAARLITSPPVCFPAV